MKKTIQWEGVPGLYKVRPPLYPSPATLDQTGNSGVPLLSDALTLMVLHILLMLMYVSVARHVTWEQYNIKIYSMPCNDFLDAVQWQKSYVLAAGGAVAAGWAGGVQIGSVWSLWCCQEVALHE